MLLTVVIIIFNKVSKNSVKDHQLVTNSLKFYIMRSDNQQFAYTCQNQNFIKPCTKLAVFVLRLFTTLFTTWLKRLTAFFFLHSVNCLLWFVNRGLKLLYRLENTGFYMRDIKPRLCQNIDMTEWVTMITSTPSSCPQY